MHVGNVFCRVLNRVKLLPYNIRDEVTSAKNFIAEHLQVMTFVVIDRYPDRTIVRKKRAQQFQSRIHHRQPLRML